MTRKIVKVLSVGRNSAGESVARVRYEDGTEEDRLCEITVEGRITRADGREELAQVTSTSLAFTNVKAGGTA